MVKSHNLAGFVSVAALGQSLGLTVPGSAATLVSRSGYSTSDRLSLFFLHSEPKLHPLHQYNRAELGHAVRLFSSSPTHLRLDESTIHLNQHFFDLNQVTHPQPVAEVALSGETGNWGLAPISAPVTYGGVAFLTVGALVVVKRQRISRAIAHIPAVLRADARSIAETLLNSSMVLLARTGFLAFLILCWLPSKKQHSAHTLDPHTTKRK